MLTGRWQRFVFNGKHSNRTTLFLIFINYLDRAVRSTDVIKKWYADDIEMGQSVITADDRDTLHQAIDSLAQCCGSGSGRIRTFLPDPEISPPNPDPDPALVVFKKISVSLQYRAYVHLLTPQM